jgi:hypothetical protein
MSRYSELHATGHGLGDVRPLYLNKQISNILSSRRVGRVACFFSTSFNLLQLYHQWDLLPQREHSLLIWPVAAFGVQCDVEVPEEPGSDESKLSVCKILANAVSWAKREGLESSFLICAKLWVVQRMIGA